MVQKYQTKRLDCWPKLLELRQQLAEELGTARERGELLVMGGETGLTSLPAGLGRFHFFAGLGPNTARIMGDYELLSRCLYQAEVMGYESWDLCGPLRLHVGAMALGIFEQSPDGKPEKPDFIFTERMCDQQAKGAQLMNDMYNASIPFFVIEAAPEPRVDYMVSQYAEFIAWMEKVTGRKYRDDLLIEATKNEWQTGVLWSRICELQKTVPAPLDLRMLFSLTTVIWRSGKHRSETIEFLQMVLDEVKDRVANKIAALATERYRLIYEGATPWFRTPTPILHYPHKYGAVCIGSCEAFTGGHGTWEILEDGTMRAAPTLSELGMKVETRQQALEALAILYLKYSPLKIGHRSIEERIKHRVRLAEDWHVDAVILNNSIGCRGNALGNAETALALKAKGFPVTVDELDIIDPKEFDAERCERRMDDFLEVQGLRLLAS